MSALTLLPLLPLLPADPVTSAVTPILKKFAAAEKNPGKLDHLNKRIGELSAGNIESATCS